MGSFLKALKPQPYLLIAVGLAVMPGARGDSVIQLGDTDLSAAAMPNYDANDPGFIELEAQIEALFGPSMPWTTANNLAEIDYWLEIVASLGGGDGFTAGLMDPEFALVFEMEGWSGVFWAEGPPADQSPPYSPEPATLVLLGGGLFFLFGYAAKYLRRRRGG
jgi:hypothetical protein